MIKVITGNGTNWLISLTDAVFRVTDVIREVSRGLPKGTYLLWAWCNERGRDEILSAAGDEVIYLQEVPGGRILGKATIVTSLGKRDLTPYWKVKPPPHWEGKWEYPYLMKLLSLDGELYENLKNLGVDRRNNIANNIEVSTRGIYPHSLVCISPQPGTLGRGKKIWGDGSESFKKLIQKAEGNFINIETVIGKRVKIGQTISNDQLTEIFKCAPRGGMRRSYETNSLVLVSDHTRGVYVDKWVDEKLHYTGEGLKGDQDIGRRQNRTLAESNKNNVEVHLFEAFESGQYLYHGRVKLAGAPYQEKQLDEDHKLRNVWIFPLQLIDVKEPVSIPGEAYKKYKEKIERKAKELTDEELDKRLKSLPTKATKRKVTSDQYQGNPEIKEKAKRLARGRCDLCDEDAPFVDKNGKPYLEGHHIIWLSQDGPDVLDNVVALCPNCHRKMHVLNIEEDIRKLKKLTEDRE